jgi:hypothetical protein
MRDDVLQVDDKDRARLGPSPLRKAARGARSVSPASDELRKSRTDLVPMPDEELIVELALIASILVGFVLLLDAVQVAIGVDESGEGEDVRSRLILEVRDCRREGKEGCGLQGEEGTTEADAREGEGSAPHTTVFGGTVWQ